MRSRNDFITIKQPRAGNAHRSTAIKRPRAGNDSDLTANERPAVGRRHRYKSVGIPGVFLTVHTLFS
jgi:hypothetical protein